MAILKPQFSAETTIAVTGLATLADTASVTADIIQDNTAALYVDADIRCTFTAGGTTTGTVDVYVKEGLTSTALSSSAKTSNMRRLGSVELNGTTPVTKVFSLNDIKPFWQLYFVNNSGAALASESVSFLGVNFTDV